MLDLALDGLAAGRLVHLIVEDRIGDRPRAALGNLHPDVDYFLGCPWCVGIWVGLAVTAARRTSAWRTIRYPLAVSAIAGFVGGLA